MAESEDSSNPDLMVSDGRISMSEARRQVALKAIFEIGALSRQAPVISDQRGIESGELGYVMRGICARINYLANAAWGALEDEEAATESLEFSIR